MVFVLVLLSLVSASAASGWNRKFIEAKINIMYMYSETSLNGHSI